MRKQGARLVAQHLEGIAGAALDEYPDVIREFIRGRNGVYALYKRDRLYYVGLARNLRSRLRGHTRDRHANKWDRFSIYLTEGDEHLKELESLVLRITEPRGNKVTGKFMASEDLRRRFRHRIKENWSRRFEEMTSWSEPERERAQRNPVRAIGPIGQKFNTVLGKYLSGRFHRFHIQMSYKGELFVAHVRRNGAIFFARESADWPRLRGKLHLSPSSAACAATGRPANGWWAWKFRSTSGEWVRLSELRAGKAVPSREL
jgi:hypothetical protein